MSAEEPACGLSHAAAALATARHPSLALAGEALPEPTLGDTVEREGALGLPEFAVQALRALALLHDLGIAHAALVPSSLRVRSTPRLGARIVLLPKPAPTDLAGVAATLPFVAPETLDGAPWGPACDLYALGAVLFHALHGRPHVRIDADLGRARAAIRAGRRSRPAAPPRTPAGLAEWIERLLEVDPAGRPASSREALTALAEATGLDLTAETPAGRAARLASGRPPGLELECEEIWRQLERADGPRLVLVSAPRGAGGHRVLDWIATRVRLDLRSDVVVLDGPCDAAEAVRRARAPGAKRLVALVPPRRFGDDPWSDVRVVRLRPLDREILRSVLTRAGDDDRASEARAARLRERSAGRYDEAALLAALGRGGRRGAGPDVGELVAMLSPAACGLAALLADLGVPLPTAEASRLAGLSPEVADSAAAELAIVGWLDVRDRTWDARVPRLARRALPTLVADVAQRLRDAVSGLAGSGEEALKIRMLVAAGDLDRAVAQAKESSGRSLEQGRPDHAAELLRLARGAVPRRDPRRAELRLLHGRALAQAGLLRAAWPALATSPDEQRRVGAALRAIPRDLPEPLPPGDHRAEACARARRGARMLVEGRLDLALGEAQAIDDFARVADDRLLRSIAAAVRGHVLLLSGRASDGGAAPLDCGIDPDWRGGRARIGEAACALHEGASEEAARIARAAAAAADDLDAPGEAAEAWAVVARASAHDPELAAAACRAGLARLETALTRIADLALRRGFSDQARFAGLRERPASLAVVDRRLLAIYEMIRRLNSATDPEALLPAILAMALEVVRAERGLILLFAPDGSVRVRVARQLENETLADAETFSRGVVAQAAAGRAVLAFDALGDDRFADLRSVSLYGIRSLMCVPLRSRGTLVGTVYVDHRGERGRFDADDLRFLEAFADHAALALENVQARATLARENRELRAAAVERAGQHGLVGDSEPMRRVLARVRIVAPSDLPVLITGESGTGKELVARAIHFHGPRREEPFVSENCAALPETLLEGELFGHVRGAFTGAERERAGLFEQADRGTLLLDEVGDMPPRMQAQLLRVLETGEVRRVGGEKTRHVDVRVLAATHRNLELAVRSGAFRADLLYRLQVLTVELPPLRERPGDVRRLVEFFLERMARERGRTAPRILPAALERLERHGWPGNVRELANVVSRAAVLAGDGPITLELLDGDPALRASGPGRSGEAGSPEPLAASEQRVMREALRAAGGNRARAARLLGISRATMYRRLRMPGSGLES